MIATVVAMVKILDFVHKRNIGIRAETIKNFDFISDFSRKLFSGKLTMIERDYGCAIIQNRCSREKVEYILRFKEPRWPLQQIPSIEQFLDFNGSEEIGRCFKGKNGLSISSAKKRSLIAFCFTISAIFFTLLPIALTMNGLMSQYAFKASAMMIFSLMVLIFIEAKYMFNMIQVASLLKRQEDISIKEPILTKDCYTKTEITLQAIIRRILK